MAQEKRKSLRITPGLLALVNKWIKMDKNEMVPDQTTFEKEGKIHSIIQQISVKLLLCDDTVQYKTDSLALIELMSLEWREVRH